MAPVYLALKKRQDVETILLTTAQHRHLLDQVLKVFSIPSDIDLNLMRPGQSLSKVSGKVLIEVQKILARLKPDAILVHGDTATCLFSALAAFYEKIPIGHVEAGLRTYDYGNPWPEEMNRRLTDPICQWCFAPTESARRNLLKEGIPDERIYTTGNTAVDALLLGLEKLGDKIPAIPGLDTQWLAGKRLILVTGHRRESFGEQLENICRALRRITDKYPDTVLVYPVHLNPNVQKPVHRILGGHAGIHLVEPLEYLPFVYLMNRSFLIITDSGGIQEEGPSLGKPVLVTREVTERPEGLAAGTSLLVGTKTGVIIREVSRLLEDRKAYQKSARTKNPYGDGKAAKRIRQALAK